LVNNKKIKIDGKIFAYDVNEPLIYMYKNIQSNHKCLYDAIMDIISEFNDCGQGELNRKPINVDEAKISKENYYYWIRSKYNELSSSEKKTVLGSAMFIFLNKTCFRGVFRVGPNGFNVPYGHYINPEIINQEHLDNVNKLIQNVEFICCDYSVSLKNINKVLEEQSAELEKETKKVDGKVATMAGSSVGGGRPAIVTL
jgi:DNA adenine methylase